MSSINTERIDTEEKRRDAPWVRLTPRAKKAMTFPIVSSLGLYGVTVGYIEYVNATTHSESFIFSFLPLIGSLFLLAVSSVAVSFYMIIESRGSACGILGSLWLLSLLPIVASLFSDFTAIDYPFIVIVAFTAVRYWRGSASRGWVLVAGIVTLVWFIIDPTGHIITLASATPDTVAKIYGVISPQAMTDLFRLAYVRVLSDLLRLTFFAAVFYFSVHRGRIIV